MKTIKPNTIEQALGMYKETVSPSEKDLFVTLNQIPEKAVVETEKATIRSPYIWLAITEVITLCFMVIVAYPTFQEMYTYRNSEFYAIDKQVEHFDSLINDEDNRDMLTDNDNL